MKNIIILKVNTIVDLHGMFAKFFVPLPNFSSLLNKTATWIALFAKVDEYYYT